MTKLLKTLKAHSDKVWSVSSHDKLPLLATASSDKTSKIYQLSLEHNFPLIGVLEETHKRSVRSVAFKPQLQSSENEFIDLPALSAGSFDSTISIWGIDEPEDLLENEQSDEEDGEESRLKREVDMLISPKNEWNLMALIEGHENEIKAVAWNRSGNYLASCSRDKTIWIWETDPETLEEFECISVLSDHEHDIKHIVWHPKYNILASSSYDDTVRLYQQDADDEDWSCVGILSGHEGTVWCSQFENPSSPTASKDKIRLASSSDDSTVRVWTCDKPGDSSRENSDLPSSIKHESDEMHWLLEQVLPQAHKYAIYSVSWSAKSGRIASAGADGQIVIYKESNGEWEIESSIKSAHGVYEINCVSWCNLSNGAEVLVSAGDDGNINIWEA
ncbi:WD40 repeat-like protein [Metschnikowia bicuspidata var. bicuspidata NRRL YB-4993]|uniref:Probable cytosolic iron-sulfur protein assembly protein 1 n=1 Tax=Metschnikowia bicuspidata var. bicuspidata NRRL YB-4993 TaxID=869754 RepID=A0A1A0HL28_9ASCO|nr:WD40 repeat-like protein [Metschnikowia bicuspidata var. bicuspidata NRRL YB-4993]OBA24513.1 WD40 repeat-like protein [Metschnikowia bicuspidata var. bicuspidata NRRL YB-4993]